MDNNFLLRAMKAAEEIDFLNLRADELFVVRSLGVKSERWLKFQNITGASSDIQANQLVPEPHKEWVENLFKLHYQILLSRGRAFQKKIELEGAFLKIMPAYGQWCEKQKHDEDLRAQVGGYSFDSINLLKEFYLHAYNALELTWGIILSIHEQRVIEKLSKEPFKVVKKVLNQVPSHLEGYLHEIKFARHKLAHGWKPGEDYRGNQWLIPKGLFQGLKVKVGWVVGPDSERNSMVDVFEKIGSHGDALDNWCEEYIYTYLCQKWQELLALWTLSKNKASGSVYHDQQLYGGKRPL